ncbi:MAG: 2,3-bisphosphoglycerate-independent phosphoglycerate mutase [Acidobacteriota bacterium]
MKDPKKRPLALIILDGWGHRQNSDRNAIAVAKTPNYDDICREFPMTTLTASGPKVGLPQGAPGSPEAGHLNLGAGRVVLTDKCRIENAIESDEFFQNKVLTNAMQEARQRGATVHVAGLLSDAGIHSTSETLFALLRLAKRQSLPEVYVHCFLDGFDVPVKTADIYVEALEVKIAEIGIGKVASLCGRHFAMDSLANWERTARAYTMMVHAEGEGVPDAKTAIRNAFLRGYTDEFISPIIVERKAAVPIATVKDGDLVIFFNHRGDTMRQLAGAVAASGDDSDLPFAKPRIEVVCMTEYDSDLGLPIAFTPETNENFLSRVLANHAVANYRITESERAPHLGNLFTGRTDGTRIEDEMIGSLDASDRGSKPEMASFKIADRFLASLDNADGGVFVVNLPAPALMAETGSFENTVEAVQYVDTCLGGMIERIREAGGTAIVTASHGGSEEMAQRASGGHSYRATSNSVPFHLVDSRKCQLRSDGALEDVAPTILGILGIEKPDEMTGTDLRVI